MTVWMFHGFLGQGSDWNPLIAELGENQLYLAPDLFHRDSQGIEPFEQWSEKFYDSVLSQVDGPFVGIGYSMGGRLLMHLAKQYPFLWRDIFVLSASVGWLQTDKEKMARQKTDDDWADKFLYGDWEEICEDWYSQPILQSEYRPERQQIDFDRAKLAKALRLWSPTRHTISPKDLVGQPFQVHHWVGEDDSKYKAEQYQLLQSQIPWDYQVYAGGHRFALENPRMLAKFLKPYLYEPCSPQVETL